VLDFTSALYLGLRHASASLKPWVQLTTGVPAAHSVPWIARRVARGLAAVQGCEAATLVPSTLHAFMDLGEIFGRAGYAILIDRGAYPISRWGMERAAMRGAFVRRFNHFDVDSLGWALRSGLNRRRPVVVCDGFCPGCGRPAPLAAYLGLVTSAGGWLLIDDTQALGIFGYSPDARRPYGEGGGGMPRFSSLFSPRLAVVASLAKGFGAPLAALSASTEFVRQFERWSCTRMHCSPPSLAVIHAAASALTINELYGETLRSRLTNLVRRFRARLRTAAIVPTGGCFPVQTLPPLTGIDAADVHQKLWRAGISTVLHRIVDNYPVRISFLVNAGHTDAMIDRAADVLRSIVERTRFSQGRGEHHDGSIHV
jgi:8-amino-7-oxononanoate synthase